MTPVLVECGGGFGYDFRIAELLKSQTGVWFAPVSRTSTVSFAVAHSTEQTSVYLGIGFMF